MQFAAKALTSSADVPLGASSRAALLNQVTFLRDVPGHPGAFVVKGPMGEQLFADRRVLGGANQGSVLRAMWAAAFHKPLPANYEAVPAPEPGPGVVYLVVIAIIAILIGLLVPAVQSVREAARTSSSPNGLHLVPSDPSLWAHIMLH